MGIMEVIPCHGASSQWFAFPHSSTLRNIMLDIGYSRQYFPALTIIVGNPLWKGRQDTVLIHRIPRRGLTLNQTIFLQQPRNQVNISRQHFVFVVPIKMCFQYPSPCIGISHGWVISSIEQSPNGSVMLVILLSCLVSLSPYHIDEPFEFFIIPGNLAKTEVLCTQFDTNGSWKIGVTVYSFIAEY